MTSRELFLLFCFFPSLRHAASLFRAGKKKKAASLLRSSSLHLRSEIHREFAFCPQVCPGSALQCERTEVAGPKHLSCQALHECRQTSVSRLGMHNDPQFTPSLLLNHPTDISSLSLVERLHRSTTTAMLDEYLCPQRPVQSREMYCRKSIKEAPILSQSSLEHISL